MAFRPVARAEDVPPGQSTFVDSPDDRGTTVAVFNAGDGRFLVCGAVCPHEEGPLSEGWLEGNVVVCPWHGFDFDLTTGQCRVDPDLRVPVFAVRVRDGTVEADLP